MKLNIKLDNVSSSEIENLFKVDLTDKEKSLKDSIIQQLDSQIKFINKNNITTGRKTLYGSRISDYKWVDAYYCVKMNYIDKDTSSYYSILIGCREFETDKMIFILNKTNSNFLTIERLLNLKMNYCNYEEILKGNLSEDLFKVVIELFNRNKDNILRVIEKPERKCFICNKEYSWSHSTKLLYSCKEHLEDLKDYTTCAFVVDNDDDITVVKHIIEKRQDLFQSVRKGIEKKKIGKFLVHGNNYNIDFDNFDASKLDFKHYHTLLIDGLKVSIALYKNVVFVKINRTNNN